MKLLFRLRGLGHKIGVLALVLCTTVGPQTSVAQSNVDPLTTNPRGLVDMAPMRAPSSAATSSPPAAARPGNAASGCRICRRRSAAWVWE